MSNKIPSIDQKLCSFEPFHLSLPQYFLDTEGCVSYTSARRKDHLIYCLNRSIQNSRNIATFK